MNVTIVSSTTRMHRSQSLLLLLSLTLSEYEFVHSMLVVVHMCVIEAETPEMLLHYRN